MLAVDVSVIDAKGAVQRTWKLSTASDIIATVGGNRYGWLVTNDFANRALDNITRTGTPKCTPTGFVRGGVNLTAAQIGGAVAGSIDATGCNIGAYNPTGVTNAHIFGANYFGIVANGRTLDVISSTVRNISESPFNGTQHGVGIFCTGASGGRGRLTPRTRSLC